MLSFITDIVGAYFIAKKTEKKLLAVFLCIMLGLASAIIMNLTIYAFASDVFTPKEILSRIIGGLVIHPIITMVAWWLWARKKKAPSRI
jgi:hypothetical protein